MTRRRAGILMTMALAGSTPAAAEDMASAEAAVKKAEAQRFAAMTAKDYTALATILADDLVYTHSTALRESKAEYMESLISGALTYLTIEPRDEVVRVYGTTAVIVAAATITSVSGGKKGTSTLRYTDVWVQRGGRWQMVAWQSTRMPEQ